MSEPEQQDQGVAAAAAKLDEMTGGAYSRKQAAKGGSANIPPGRVTSTPGAAAVAAKPSQAAEARVVELRRDPRYYEVGTAHQRKLADEVHRLMTGAATDVLRDGETENQAAIRNLNQSGKLTSQDPAVRAAAMNDLRRRLVIEATADEKDAIANAPIDALRDQFRVDHSKVLAPIRDKWDEHEEGTALATFAQQGVAPEAVTAITDWYITKFNGALGNAANVDPVEMEAEFRKLATKHGIADSVADALVEHHRGRIK